MGWCRRGVSVASSSVLVRFYTDLLIVFCSGSSGAVFEIYSLIH